MPSSQNDAEKEGKACEEAVITSSSVSINDNNNINKRGFILLSDDDIEDYSSNDEDGDDDDDKKVTSSTSQQPDAKSPMKKPKNGRNNDNNDGDDDDQMVEIVSPPPKIMSRLKDDDNNVATGVGVGDTATNSKDDALGSSSSPSQIQVSWSNLTNPNIDYPHKRIDCGLYDYNTTNPESFCPKCYCVECDIPANECSQWKNNHCHIKVNTTKAKKTRNVENEHGEVTVISNPPSRLLLNRARHLRRRQEQWHQYNAYLPERVREDLEDALYSSGQDPSALSMMIPPPNFLFQTQKQQQLQLQNAIEKMRITEVLSHKLSLAVKNNDGIFSTNHITDSSTSHQNDKDDENDDDEYAGIVKTRSPSVSKYYSMEGDIATLRLHNSFFVEGVKIGWPFSTILQPQRLMAIHITKALKRSLHVVLESPTGTGKSAAILCATLAWQRYHHQMTIASNGDGGGSKATSGMQKILSSSTQEIDDNHNEGGDDRSKDDDESNRPPTIIYCSRTHSQVAQMVASLRKTPYRPRMCVLGSRDRMCINQDLVGGNNDNKTKGGSSLNHACRDRKIETDRVRKRALKANHDVPGGRSNPQYYDDDNPPTTGGGGEEDIENMEFETDNHNNEDGTEQREGRRRRKKPTCPHYRQLSSQRTAQLAKNRFLWNVDKVCGCSTNSSSSSVGNGCGGVGGGEETTMGSHDVEDLVKFGKQPLQEVGIVLYCHATNVAALNDGKWTNLFGFSLVPRPQGGVCVLKIEKNGIADKDGRIQKGDWILNANGVNTQDWDVTRVSEYLSQLLKKEIAPKKSNNSGSSVTLVLGVEHDITFFENSCASEKDDHGIERDNEHSEHAVCPYYLSRALLHHADLVFCPYNYILDPSIRNTLGIELEGSVVVIDEAHNVEGTLCESGSGDFGEFDFCQLIGVLARYSNQYRGNERADRNLAQMELVGENRGESSTVSEGAHELLLFVENLVLHLRGLREKFQASPGLEKVKRDHSRFKLSDDHAEEIVYRGPSGFGLKGEAVGCLPLLQDLGITSTMCTRLNVLAQSLESHLFGGRNDGDGEEDKSGEAVLNDLIGILSKLEIASKNPEHFYMACVMKPNGNIDYATEKPDAEYDELMSRQTWRKHPKQVPVVSPRTLEHPNVPLQVCNHKQCTAKNDRGYFEAGHRVIRHGEFCNAERPRWECHLVLRLLSPGLLMKDISQKCRTLVLASGSLAPLQSLCAELNLYPPKENATTDQTLPKSSRLQGSSMLQPLSPNSPVVSKVSQCTAGSQQLRMPTSGTNMASTSSKTKLYGRLQVTPKPLEANHVVTLPKQLYAAAIGSFPDGGKLTVTYSNYKEGTFFPRLGNALASVIESIPSGGVLVFVPSYSFLNKCVRCWNPSSPDMNSNSAPYIWHRFIQSKGHVIVEPTGIGSQEKFEEARETFSRRIQEGGTCILLAVFRGKMSEGISFNDNNARCVVCVGLPYPNSFDRNIKAKMAYNDEQRKIRKNTYLLPGQEWYSQQAYRAIAQALGRCIRHGADYGSILFLDSRFCDDGSPNDGLCARTHKNLPKWMRHHVRTLSMHHKSGVGRNPILGGYAGMRTELKNFFLQAPTHSQTVLTKWKLDLEAARLRSRETQGHTFDQKTGNWMASPGRKKSRQPESVKAEPMK